MDSLDKALAINSSDATAWNIRGIALAGLERYDEAVNSFDKALAVDPNNASTWFSRGAALANLERLQEAVDSCDKALAIDPENATAWVNRGFALDKLERCQEAVDSFDRALAIDPNNAAIWYVRGVALAGLERYQEAVNSYEEALKHNPDLSLAYEGKLEALDKLEEWLKARLPPEPLVQLYKLVFPSEIRLRLFIQQRLQQAFGGDETQWWVKGVPEKIRLDCAQMREKGLWQKQLIDYTYFINLKEILEKKGNWKIVEGDFQRIKGLFKSKDDFLNGLLRMNDLRNMVAHPTPNAVSTQDDFDFARHMREVIEQFCGPG